MANNNNHNNNHHNNPPPPSSSSFTADLFGDNHLQSSSTGIFSSIFPPASTVLRGNSNFSHFNGVAQKENSQNQVWTATHGTSAENVAKNSASANSSVMNMERRSIYHQRVEPSPLSSSLYYGGQEDMYVCSSTARLHSRILNLRKWTEKMIQIIRAVLLEEIGGKGLSIIKTATL